MAKKDCRFCLGVGYIVDDEECTYRCECEMMDQGLMFEREVILKMKLMCAKQALTLCVVLIERYPELKQHTDEFKEIIDLLDAD